MPLTIKQRFTANFLHHVQGLSPAMIAIAMESDEREVQDWLDVGEDYIAGDKPRRRAKREETSSEPPKTRARTNSNTGGTAVEAETAMNANAVRSPDRIQSIGFLQTHSE